MQYGATSKADCRPESAPTLPSPPSLHFRQTRRSWVCNRQPQWHAAVHCYHSAARPVDAEPRRLSAMAMVRLHVAPRSRVRCMLFATCTLYVVCHVHLDEILSTAADAFAVLCRSWQAHNTAGIYNADDATMLVACTIQPCSTTRDAFATLCATTCVCARATKRSGPCADH